MKPGSAEMNLLFNFGENYRLPDNALHFHRSLTFVHTDDQTLINSTLALRVRQMAHFYYLSFLYIFYWLLLHSFLYSIGP